MKTDVTSRLPAAWRWLPVSVRPYFVRRSTSVRRKGTAAVQGRKPGWERDKEGVVNIVNEFH